MSRQTSGSPVILQGFTLAHHPPTPLDKALSYSSPSPLTCVEPSIARKVYLVRKGTPAGTDR